MERCMKLKDKVVVITGAAQGLGQALAQRCSDEGAKVVVGDMNFEGAQKTAALLNDAVAVSLDVTKIEDCNQLIKTAVDQYGKVDMLVCNAAIVISGAI
ncbi:MAG: SDR family NAD(P)-dependent oxidoreductase, partial [Christensenellaceae bacterium]